MTGRIRIELNLSPSLVRCRLGLFERKRVVFEECNAKGLRIQLLEERTDTADGRTSWLRGRKKIRKKRCRWKGKERRRTGEEIGRSEVGGRQGCGRA